jgi:hypothetical protein
MGDDQIPTPPPFEFISRIDQRKASDVMRQNRSKDNYSGVLAELLSKVKKMGDDGKPIELTAGDLLKVAGYGFSANFRTAMDELLSKTPVVPAGIDFEVRGGNGEEGWKIENRENTDKREKGKSQDAFGGVMSELLEKVRRIESDGSKKENMLTGMELLQCIGLSARARQQGLMKELVAKVQKASAGIDLANVGPKPQEAWKEEALANEAANQKKNFIAEINEKVPKIEADVDHHYATPNKDGKPQKEAWKLEIEEENIKKDRMKNQTAFGGVFAELLQKVKKIDELGEPAEMSVLDILKATAFLQSSRCQAVMKELQTKVPKIEAGIDHAQYSTKEGWKEEREQEKNISENAKSKDRFNAVLFELINKKKRIGENGEPEAIDSLTLFKATVS